MSSNPFVLPVAEYRRDINVLKHYVEDTATYLSKMTGKPADECVAFVRASLRKGGEFEFKDPAIVFMERGENGDREKKEGTLSVYLNEAIKERELIAPTLTTYINPAKKQSLLVAFIDGNVKARGVAKKAMFAAKAAGDKPTEAIKKTEQTNKKLNNNSISGAHVSASTPLYNKTAHNTLTSNCRSTSAYGNANNEKFLCGNRHYWCPDIVRNNIISIVNHSNYDLIREAMMTFGIRHPSIEETMQCIKYSTDFYWKTKHDLKRISALVGTLTDEERSAFVYTGDVFHLMRFNDAVVRKFIGKLSAKSTTEHPNPDAVFATVADDVRNLAVQICSVEMKGKTIKDVKGTPVYGILAGTIENILNTLQEYFILIRAFWVTPNVPSSVAVFPDSIRRAAITSDTDSTIFTVQDWVIWYQGKLGFDSVSNAIADTMVFLAAQSIVHVLARMSANFGIEQKRLFQIAMKNEFKFDVFVPTQHAKHYYASISAQEGLLFKAYEYEIKGVHLKSSNAPKAIMERAAEMMKDVLDTVARGEMVSLDKILKEVADLERAIMHGLKTADARLFRRAQLKTAESYKQKEAANVYQQYLMWNEVFGPKYGMAPPLPYMALKISVELDKPGKVHEWLSAIKDQELRARLQNWLLFNRRKHIGKVLLIPEQIVLSTGVPDEIMAAMDTRGIILDITNVFYIVLETLGIYMLNEKTTRMIMEEY